METIQASHILVKTEQEAIDLKSKIKNGKDFAKAAKEFSLCPTGKEGGRLAPFSKGEMDKPFEDAAFALDAGEISDPVKTQYGYHLIYIEMKQGYIPNDSP